MTTDGSSAAAALLRPLLQLATRLEAPTYKSKAVSLVQFLVGTKRVL